MSVDFCLNAVASSLQLGRRQAGIKSLSATELATRNDTDTGLVTLEVATPTADDHATTKAYVDGLLNGISWKEPARTCSVTDVNISSPGAIIGTVTMVSGDRVLLLSQTSPSEEGLWVWNGAASAMTRPADYAAGSTQNAPAVFVEEGLCADQAYVGTADPITVDTTDPAFTLFGSITPGVTSIADAATVPPGGTSLIGSGAAPTPTINVLDDSARISVALAAGVITLDIVALSIDTAQLADQGVTIAKIAPNATHACLPGQITFSDQGTTVSLGTLPANSRVTDVEVDVTTQFDSTAITVDVQVNSVSVQGPTDSDLNAVDQYRCAANEENAASVGVDAVVSAATVTQGVADICVKYRVTA